MAGNSVPVFFGAKARTKKPPGLDVTSITDLSGSMGSYAAFISSLSTFQALETALVAQEIGVLSSNRYSFASGGGQSPSFTTLPQIERNVTVDGVSTRWAPGANILEGTATLPALTANQGSNTEDMGIAANLMTSNDRNYLTGNERIIIAGSDEQSYGAAFSVSPAYPHRYIGVHSVTLSISEPAGPNAIPAGTLVGFVYTTSTTGAAIYLDGSTLNYRLEVPVANVTATAAASELPGQSAPTLQINVDHAKTTNGAIYKVNSFGTNFTLLAESLGTVLGQYLYDIS
jgi:hypothetical protein